ncbi:TrkH family potassium uptake protein [Aquicoccus sp. SCR17]|nr:TrkH family potassium uptake protein [Carideicomes alvinocaridis]
MERLFLRLPLFLVLAGIFALAMYLPAGMALAQEEFRTARSFFYSATLLLILLTLIAIAQSNRQHRESGLRQLLALLGAFTALPVLLAVPLHDSLRGTSFLDAYMEMVSSITTTGLPLFDPEALIRPLHLWRGLVGWMGGFLMWVAAAAILAPLNLGGFEVTATAEPGQEITRHSQIAARRDATAHRLRRTTFQLFPIYTGLTGALWLCLLVTGGDPFVSIVHAMSVMATSGISPIGGLEYSATGVAGEMLVFLFLFFALSRLTFSSDTVATRRTGLYFDPEFRIGIILVIGVPLLLFFRHWLGAYEFDEQQNLVAGLHALWGGMFTVLSFLSTTGFESVDWQAARGWSGLDTPGLILLGLSLVGGGVATTAGGVKLLRVYALYLNGMREIERLVHPSSVGRASAGSRRLRRQGAFVAWIFFMLYALTLTLITVILAGLGSDLESSVVLSISTLSTTGPLVSAAPEAPIHLAEMNNASKLVLCAAMALGRLEMLAIIALFTTDLWRE